MSEHKGGTGGRMESDTSGDNIKCGYAIACKSIQVLNQTEGAYIIYDRLEAFIHGKKTSFS